MPFETFDIYTAGYCLMRGHMPRCVPAPGNRYKFVFTETARAIAAEFDATEFASFADACRRLKRLMFTAPPTRHDNRHRGPRRPCQLPPRSLPAPLTPADRAKGYELQARPDRASLKTAVQELACEHVRALFEEKPRAVISLRVTCTSRR